MKSIVRAALLLIVLLLGINNADANLLVGTSPTSGSTITVTPTSVSVTGQVPLLADAVDANQISVLDPNGVRVDDGTITVSDLTASVGIRALVEPGIYTVTYSLIAEGDAPLAGSFTFKFLPPTTVVSEQPSPESTQSQAPASSSWATNFFVIALLIFAAVVTVGLFLYARKLFSNR